MEVNQDLQEAKRCIRELAALSLLPAIWSGGKPEGLGAHLADALQNTFHAKIAYVRFRITAGRDTTETLRLNAGQSSPENIALIRKAVDSSLNPGGSDLVKLTWDNSAIRLFVMPLGANQEFGVIAIGSCSPDFPNSTDRLLLNVATNHAIIAFRSVRQIAELADASDQKQLALEVGALGAWDYRFDTGQVYWDERCRSIWGVPSGDQLSYAEVIKRIHPEEQPIVNQAVENALAGLNEGKYQCEFRVIWPDGSVRWVNARGQAYFAGSGEKRQPIRFVGVVRDVTEEKAASELLENTVKLRTSQLQETVGELEAFSYSISHDMRSPLRAMQGYADALLEKYQPLLDDKGMHYLDRIRIGSRRLDMLIQDVLAYSKVAKGEIQLGTVDLNVTVNEVIESYPQLQAPNAKIVIDSPLPSVIGHEAYLTQIVSNLLSNAVKFVPEGVFPQVRIRAETHDGFARIWFEDNGIGIESKDQTEIFKIFGRVYSEKRFEGTGIGLAIVRKAVERLGGTLGLVSTAGNGSSFWINLRKPA